MTNNPYTPIDKASGKETKKTPWYKGRVAVGTAALLIGFGAGSAGSNSSEPGAVPEATSTATITATATVIVTPEPVVETVTATPSASADLVSGQEGEGAQAGQQLTAQPKPTTSQTHVAKVSAARQKATKGTATKKAKASKKAAKPKPAKVVKPKPAKKTKSQKKTSGSTYYKNCSAARAAGAAPVHRGDPGYGKHLDRDGDGIGCEN